MEVTLAEYLKSLDGCEVNSLKYEGVVGVRGHNVVQHGKVIDTLGTISKAKALFDEMFVNEFGSNYMNDLCKEMELYK